MPDNSLNIATYLQNSRVNGPGNRDVFWVQGCSIRCPGCFNEDFWSFEPRHIMRIADLADKMKERVGQIEGVSILGGEPMHQARALAEFLEGVKKLGLTTVVYTGFTLEYLIKQDNPPVSAVLGHTDVLIDGPYVAALQEKTLIWRGSSNQRIRFLSDTYSERDIPSAESYRGIEIHTLMAPDDREITIRKTGII